MGGLGLRKSGGAKHQEEKNLIVEKKALSTW